MAAIGEVIVAAVVFIFEMLVLSLIGLYKVCRALLSKKGRIEIRETWVGGRKDRVALFGGILIAIPVLLVGFGLGLPLAYHAVKGMLSKNAPSAAPRVGLAEVTLPHPKDPSKQLKVLVDRNRLHELKETMDLPDLLKKFREISTTTVEEKKPDDPADRAARPSTNAGDRTNNPRGTP
jgi:hypothetical protein